MEKEFVRYELAVKLKEIGFNEPCLCSWNFYTNELNFNGQPSTFSSEDVIQLPTFSQAFRWFREKYRMFHEVFIDTEPTIEEPDKLEFAYLILHMIGSEYMHTSKNKRFKTYEEAELTCLIKLIEIINI